MCPFFLLRSVTFVFSTTGAAKQWGSRRVWGWEGCQHHLVRMGMLAGLMTKAALKNPS